MIRRPTVELERVPTEGEFLRIIDEALKDCECHNPKLKGMVCQPCTSRNILNGIIAQNEILE